MKRQLIASPFASPVLKQICTQRPEWREGEEEEEEEEPPAPLLQKQQKQPKPKQPRADSNDTNEEEEEKEEDDDTEENMAPPLSLADLQTETYYYYGDDIAGITVDNNRTSFLPTAAASPSQGEVEEEEEEGEEEEERGGGKEGEEVGEGDGGEGELTCSYRPPLHSTATSSKWLPPTPHLTLDSKRITSCYNGTSLSINSQSQQAIATHTHTRLPLTDSDSGLAMSTEFSSNDAVPVAEAAGGGGGGTDGLACSGSKFDASDHGLGVTHLGQSSCSMMQLSTCRAAAVEGKSHHHRPHVHVQDTSVAPLEPSHLPSNKAVVCGHLHVPAATEESGYLQHELMRTEEKRRLENSVSSNSVFKEQPQMDHGTGHVGGGSHLPSTPPLLRLRTRGGGDREGLGANTEEPVPLYPYTQDPGHGCDKEGWGGGEGKREVRDENTASGITPRSILPSRMKLYKSQALFSPPAVKKYTPSGRSGNKENITNATTPTRSTDPRVCGSYFAGRGEFTGLAGEILKKKETLRTQLLLQDGKSLC